MVLLAKSPKRIKKLRAKWLQDCFNEVDSLDQYNKHELCRIASSILPNTNVEPRWLYLLLSEKIHDPSINKVYAVYRAAKILKNRGY